MSISVEFSPELALREVNTPGRLLEECIPESIKEGEVYNFLKRGQRIYWLNEEDYWSQGEMPLVKTFGGEKTTFPIASIKILEVTHFIKEKQVWTRGRYKVIHLIKEGEVYFNSCRLIKDE